MVSTPHKTDSVDIQYHHNLCISYFLKAKVVNLESSMRGHSFTSIYACSKRLADLMFASCCVASNFKIQSVNSL